MFCLAGNFDLYLGVDQAESRIKTVKNHCNNQII